MVDLERMRASIEAPRTSLSVVILPSNSLKRCPSFLKEFGIIVNQSSSPFRKITRACARIFDPRLTYIAKGGSDDVVVIGL